MPVSPSPQFQPQQPQQPQQQQQQSGSMNPFAAQQSHGQGQGQGYAQGQGQAMSGAQDPRMMSTGHGQVQWNHVSQASVDFVNLGGAGAQGGRRSPDAFSGLSSRWR